MRGFIRQRGSSWTAYWSVVDGGTGKRVQHSHGGFARKEPARPPRSVGQNRARVSRWPEV